MENSNNPSNRLYLNFNNNENKFQPADSRTYPTTPSTFPNPIFPGQQQQQSQQAQQNTQQQPYSTGFAPAGYFMNNPYPPTYPQQPPSTNYQAPQPPQAAYQQRSNAPLNDATNGLVHQFSHQNLGGRQSPYGQRQPSPSQRPRTAGAPGQQAGYGSYLNAPMPSQPAQSLPEFQLAPERNSDKYGSIAQNNMTKCKTLAEAFFKDSVKRARDRNLR
jgi:protein-serine/threonine kinase